MDWWKLSQHLSDIFPPIEDSYASFKISILSQFRLIVHWWWGISFPLVSQGSETKLGRESKATERNKFKNLYAWPNMKFKIKYYNTCQTFWQELYIHNCKRFLKKHNLQLFSWFIYKVYNNRIILNRNNYLTLFQLLVIIWQGLCYKT